MHKHLKKFSFMAAVVLFAAQITNVAFADDISNHWAQKAIGELHQQGLISGYEDNSFKPDDYMTRAEYVSVVNKVMKFTDEKEISFSDVKDGDWYKNAIAVAVANGYCSGYEDATFRPNAKITRAEASVMLSKALGLTEAIEDFKFSDASEIPSWAKMEINRLVGAKYISGYPDSSFKAQNNISRAEAFAMLHRVVQKNEVIEYLEINKDGEVVKDKEIKGDLVINKSVGEGHVTVENTKIHSNLIIRGGGRNSVYLKNVEIDGKIIVEKEGMRLQLQEDTTVKDVETKASCILSGEHFTGKVENLIVADTFQSKNSVEVKLPLENINVKKTASLVVEGNVQKINVAKEAANSKIDIKKKAEINTIAINAKVSITGEGTVKTIRLNGVSADISETIKSNTQIIEEKKEDSNSSSGGGSGSSSAKKIEVTEIKINGEKDFSEEAQEKTFTVEYTPVGAYHKGVEWKITEGQEYINIKTQDTHSVTLQAKDNGNYTLQAVLRGKSEVKAEISGQVTGQVVTLEDGSVTGATVGDKKITGVARQKAYYLKSGIEFYSVKKDGMIEKQSSEEEAITKSEKLEADEITVLDNEKAYLLREVTKEVLLNVNSKGLEMEVKAFLAKYQGEYAIGTKNVDLVEKEYGEIEKKVNEFIREIQGIPSLEKIWTGYQDKLKTLKAKIEEEKETRQTAIKEIKALLEQITGKFDAKKAHELVVDIGGKLDYLSDEAQQEFHDLDKYKDLKKDVDLFEKVANFTFALQPDGMLNVQPGKGELTEDVFVVLKLKKGDVEVNNFSKEINLKDTSTFNELLLGMRNEGAGTYRVIAEYKADTFRYVDVKPSEVEGTVEIKEIENTLQMLELDENLEPKSGGSANVSFNKETGEITWDEVENATSYDVWVEVTQNSREGVWGKYYLVQEGNEFENIQNEFESSELIPIEESNGKFYQSDFDKKQTVSERIHAGIGLTERKINFSEIIPVEGTSFSFNSGIADDEDYYLTVYIIPRNQGSIYITKDYGNLTADNTRLVQFAAQVKIERVKWSLFKQYLPAWKNS